MVLSKVADTQPKPEFLELRRCQPAVCVHKHRSPDSTLKKLGVWNMLTVLPCRSQAGRLQELRGQPATSASPKPVHCEFTLLTKRMGKRVTVTAHKNSTWDQPVLHTHEHTNAHEHTHICTTTYSLSHTHTLGYAHKQNSSCSICRIWNYLDTK